LLTPVPYEFLIEKITKANILNVKTVKMFSTNESITLTNVGLISTTPGSLKKEFVKTVHLIL